ncbi:MAG TPA: glycerol-3-phosphate ABC transporter ATP-binding protein [Lentisphaeria bacterium]|nr:MAG: hypothetical protein A2X48_00305 [Lentisphaerae bacterium GWF2_49_21]HBC88434.1 glycerol-3-phosphate ABC transporter ATP-binding protein [Lentisphaeria bacterium]
MAAIILEHLTKLHPGNIRAVDDFSLEIIDGELLVLVGPSGCGKTTLLRLIAGLDDPDSGSISIGGRIVNELPPKDRDMAMVFQNYALYPNLDAHDNVGFSLKMRKQPKAYIEKKIKHATEMVEFMERLTAMPKALSGGEQQKVAVGRAIARNPSAFLFDEPLGMLDAIARARLRPKLKILHTMLKTTTIHVTHDQVEAMGLADRICIMREGKMEQVGTPMEIYDGPVNLFVAGFLGSPPMNLVDGELVKKEAGIFFRSKALDFQLPPEWQKRCIEKNGSTVVLGIRSESLRIDVPQETSGKPGIKGVADLVELFGPASHVHLKTPDGILVGTADNRSGIKIGNAVTATVDLERIHLFAKDTGLRA